MKKLILTIIRSLLFLGMVCLNGCKEEVETGTLTFWTSENITGGNIRVTLNDKGAQTITGYYEGAADVTCGAEYTATFSDLSYGIYSYTATNGVYTWTGSEDVSTSCERIKLGGWNAD